MDVNNPNIGRSDPFQPLPANAAIPDVGLVGHLTNESRSRRTPVWLWVVTIALLLVGVWMQRPEPDDPKDIAKEAAGLGEIKPPKASGIVLIGKAIIAIEQAEKSGGPTPQPDPAGQLVSMSDTFAGWVGTSKMAPASATNPPRKPKEPEPAAERLRAAIIAGEVVPPEEMAWRVEDVERTLDPESKLNDDVAIVRKIYGLPAGKGAGEGSAATGETKDEAPAKVGSADNSDASGSSGAGPSSRSATSGASNASGGVSASELAASHAAVGELTDEQKKGFRERHGWFAELALSRGDTTSTLREDAATQGMALIMLLILIGLGVLAAGLTGFVLLIIAAVKMIGGTFRWGLARPAVDREWPVEATGDGLVGRRVALATPGSVWLETVAVFFAMFIGIKLGTGLLSLAHVGKQGLIGATLALQWVVALAIFWPLVRGMSWSRWKEEIGWRAPRGVLREVGAGIVGYVTGLPVLFGAAVIVTIGTLIYDAITQSEPHPPSNKITDLLEGGAPWEIAMIFLLATVWAPIVEESIFRGCLYRHLRRRLVVPLAALGSALAFAALHGYVIQGLIVVGTLGFWFAMMREWRGSIVATATAHALHNGMVMILMIIVLSMAGA